MTQLSGQVALVTGASRGVGRGVALGLADTAPEPTRSPSLLLCGCGARRVRGRRLSTLALEDLGVIDDIGTSRATDDVVLSITHHLERDDRSECLLILQEKII